MRRHIARLQAFLHANEQTLRNLASEAVDIASIDGGIWEAKSGGNNLLVRRVSTQNPITFAKKI